MDLRLPATEAPLLPAITEPERLGDAYAVVGLDARRQVISLFRPALGSARGGDERGAGRSAARPRADRRAGRDPPAPDDGEGHGLPGPRGRDGHGQRHPLAGYLGAPPWRGPAPRAALVDGDLQRESSVVNVIAHEVRSLTEVADAVGGPESPTGVRQIGHAGMRQLQWGGGGSSLSPGPGGGPRARRGAAEVGRRRGPADPPPKGRARGAPNGQKKRTPTQSSARGVGPHHASAAYLRPDLQETQRKPTSNHPPAAVVGRHFMTWSFGLGRSAWLFPLDLVFRVIGIRYGWLRALFTYAPPPVLAITGRLRAERAAWRALHRVPAFRAYLGSNGRDPDAIVPAGILGQLPETDKRFVHRSLSARRSMRQWPDPVHRGDDRRVERLDRHAVQLDPRHGAQRRAPQHRLLRALCVRRATHS